MLVRVTYGRDRVAFVREEGLKVARAVARRALFIPFVFLALAPASVLAFTPPDPNSPGHHFGELIHNPHLRSGQPAPGTGGGGGGSGSGVQNSFGSARSGTAGPSTGGLPAFQLHPTPLSLPQLTGGANLGQDAWLVVIILASLLAANVVLAVLWVSRGGHFVYRRALRPVLVPA